MDYRRLEEIRTRYRGGGKRNTVDSGAKKAATTDKGVRTRSDDGNWITINGTHVPIDKDGSLMGSVGAKISGSSKSTASKSASSNIIFGSHSVKAKSEKDAVSKINKQLKDEGLKGKNEGHYKKVVKDKYTGLYTLTRVTQFNVGGKIRSKSDGSSQGEFILKPDGNGNYVSKPIGRSNNFQD